MEPLIFNPDARWRAMVIYTPRLIHVWRHSPQHTLSRRLDWYWCGLDAVGKIKTLWGVESRFLGCSALRVVAMLTTLSPASTNSVIIKIIQFWKKEIVGLIKYLLITKQHIWKDYYSVPKVHTHFFIWHNFQPNAGHGLLIHKVSRSHTERATVDRTPLDEWSAHRRDLYLRTHNTHDRHLCPRWDSNPQSQ